MTLALERQHKSLFDYAAMIISTVGVGYIPIPPGTWGSAVGVSLFIAVRNIESQIAFASINRGASVDSVWAWIHVGNLVALFLLCSVGFWSATRTAVLLRIKDPQKVVIDEVMGSIDNLLVPTFISLLGVRTRRFFPF